MAHSDEILKDLLSLDRASAAAIVDCSSEILVASSSIGLDMKLAAGGSTEVIRTKLRTMDSLNLNDSIEDILIILSGQCHLIRSLNLSGQLFTYYVLDRNRTNLALARRKLKISEEGLII